MSCSQATLSWNASTDPGGPGIKGYNVYVLQNGTWWLVSFVTTTYATISNLAAMTAYYYSVAAIDNANPANQSALSPSVSVATPACTTTTVAASTTTTTTTTSLGGVAGVAGDSQGRWERDLSLDHRGTTCGQLCAANKVEHSRILDDFQ